MENKNYYIHGVASGLNNFIDSLHDRIELLNTRVLLIDTLGNYDLTTTKNELLMLSKMRVRFLEINDLEEMAKFLNSINDTIMDSKLRTFLIRKLKS